MLLKGFKFGMLLQLSIGPVCLFIFQLASSQGFFSAEAGVLGVSLVDALYILAALMGIASLIEKKHVKTGLKLFGAFVLFLFGVSILLSQFNIHLLPRFILSGYFNSDNAFFSAALITISNPLTIIFWAGVFSSKVAEENMHPKELYTFGFGAFLSTLLFLTCIACVGSFTTLFFTAYTIQILNLIIGLMLVYFSIKLLFKH